jgi:hypothetical protein
LPFGSRKTTPLAAVKTGTVNMAKDIGTNMGNARVPTVSF